MQLGAERLAEELLLLSNDTPSVADRIDYIISSSRENISRFEVQLEELSDSGFYDWRMSSDYAHQLSHLIENLKGSVENPCEGVVWISRFFEKDHQIMESCDDSYGEVSGIFLGEATECFIYFAKRCDDKKRVGEQLLDLVLDNDYGVRDQLIESVSQFMPVKWLRWLVDQLWSYEDGEDCMASTHRTVLLKSLAKQLKDAALYEQVVVEGDLSFSDCLDIAQVYLDCGDAEKASGWIDQADQEYPSENHFRLYDYREIRREICHQLGDRSGEEEMAWAIFRQSRSLRALNVLLQTLGEVHRDRVIAQEVEQILGGSADHLVEQDVSFLLELGKAGLAEQYLMARTALLKTVFYGVLTTWGNQLKERPLLASLIYRALLNDILDQGKSKAYHHAVDYWIELQHLSPGVEMWEPYLTDVQFQQQIKQKHGRKWSFWKQLDERG